MAPEQITGTGLDVRADIYATGVLLYELLADRRPFLSERRSELLRAHLLQPPPPLTDARSELCADPALEAIVMRCLAKAPEARYADGLALLEALEALPPNAAYLKRPTPSPQQRSRAGATSEVISSAERRAVSESITGVHVAANKVALAAPEVRPSVLAPPSGAVARKPGPAPEPATAESATESAADRVPPSTLPPPPEPRVSTALLYVVAAGLFTTAALLWLWLGPR
jgi:serine/threonine-protein kinase